MRRLVWAFAGRTYHIVGYLMSWLNLVIHHVSADLARKINFSRPMVVLRQWLFCSLMLFVYYCHIVCGWGIRSLFCFAELCVLSQFCYHLAGEELVSLLLINVFLMACACWSIIFIFFKYFDSNVIINIYTEPML